MTALAADKPDMTGLVDSRYNKYPVAASTTIYLGAMVVLNYLGQAIPAASALMGHCRVVGVSVGRLQPGSNSPVDNGTAVAVSAGDFDVQVETGKQGFVNAGSGNGYAAVDTITSADIGCWAYACDDQTVSRDSSNGNRAVVGEIKAIGDDGKVYVQITGERWFSRVDQFLANADLSLLRNTQVALSAAAAPKLASATAATAKTIGVLINAPTSGQMGQVVTFGPAPLEQGSGGVTGGDAVTATTGGKGLTTVTAADQIVGTALESKTSLPGMVFVNPRSL